MPARLKVRIKKFLGIDNVNESQRVNKGTLSIATNVDIKNDQSLLRRQGYAEVATGDFHSFWSNGKVAFAVKDGKLVRIFQDYSSKVLGNYSGVEAGVVYVDGMDGFIYCAGRGFLIQTDGVNVTPAYRPTGDTKKSYNTKIGDYDITQINVGLEEIKREKSNINGATVLEVYRGRMYAGVDNVLWYSDSYDFRRMLKRSKNFFGFSTDLTAIKAVDNGVYVSEEDRVWFLKGTSPENFDFTVVYDSGILRGSEVRVDNIAIGEQVISPAIIWTTKKGICVGSPDGRVYNMTEKKYDMPDFITGAAMFRQGGGLDQYLTILNS